MHVHAVEDVLSQLLPRHLGRGGHGPRVGAHGAAEPARSGAGGEGPRGTGPRFARHQLCSVVLVVVGRECTDWARLRDPSCHLTSMEQRQCASLMDTSFPQALEMVRWSYCGAAVAELGPWSVYAQPQSRQAFSPGLFYPVLAQQQGPIQALSAHM